MKKRILFYYDNYCGSSSKGGTEVATFRIASALVASGECDVYNAFMRQNPEKPDNVYKGILKLRNFKKSFVESLGDFIRRNEIDVVVNMGRFFRHDKLKDSIERSGRNVKLIFMHHFAPGSESKKIKPSAALHLLKLNPLNGLYWLRFFFYPLVKLPRRLSMPKAYRKVHEKSDAIVLLSPSYLEQYRKIAGLDRDSSKFFAIPNIFPPRVSGGDSLQNKEKNVLILSRMDEIQKRISLSLQVWKKIEERGDLDDWKLDIVGSGHDIKAIKKLAKSLELKNVIFHGWQNGLEFLKKSSILMSTSDYEGLSLSMIEAQSLGCVPVAFNSYSSLQDIVEDGVNGVCVSPYPDTEAFANRLANVMLDASARENMMLNGLNSSSRFSPEKIAGLWLSLLSSLEPPRHHNNY